MHQAHLHIGTMDQKGTCLEPKILWIGNQKYKQ